MKIHLPAATAFHIANPIFAAMESPKCAGNESSLTECEGDPRPLEKQCYPVLVKCGTSKAQSSGASGHVVTASVISSLFGTLTICATLLTVIILCYKFKIKSVNNSLR